MRRSGANYSRVGQEEPDAVKHPGVRCASGLPRGPFGRGGRPRRTSLRLDAQSVLSLTLTEALGEALLASLPDSLAEKLGEPLASESEALTELLAESPSVSVLVVESAARATEALSVSTIGAAAGAVAAAAKTSPVTTDPTTVHLFADAMTGLPSPDVRMCTAVHVLR
jgi:hypothetical protein